MDRVERERGVEFTTYATPTIVGEIKRYFRDKGWAVKVPRRLQELNLAVNRAVEKLSIKIGRSPTVHELAEHLNASDEEILEAQELGQAYNLLSLDTEISGDGDGKSQTLADVVGSDDMELAMLEDRTIIERAFTILNGRERVILHSASTKASARPRSPSASTSARCISRASSRRRSKSSGPSSGLTVVRVLRDARCARSSA